MGAVALISELGGGGGSTPIQDALGLPTPGELIGGVTGQTAADASAAAAQLQYQATQDALNYQKEKDALARADLQPFAQFGQNSLFGYGALLNPQVQASYLESNPMFQAALGRSERGLRNTLGFGGKRGDLENAITQNYLATGNQYLQQQMDNIFRGVNLGQASAAGQALGAQNAASAGSNLITGGANALGAGLIGAANAQQAGAGNIATIGAGLLGAFMCDVREKRDIIPLYKDRDGLRVYAFRYKDHDDWYNGKMAQDIRRIDPSHVFEWPDGRLHVSAKYAPVRVH